MQASPVPGAFFGAVSTRYRRNPLGFAHTITPPRRDNIATVNRMASFQSWIAPRPQWTRPQSPAAAESSAEPSPLGPFPQPIPGSWERSQHLFRGPSQAQVWVVSRSRSLTPHHSLGTSRSVSTQRPSGRRAARSVAPTMAAVRRISTLRPVTGCDCDARRDSSPSAGTPTRRNSLSADRTSPTRRARTRR